MMGMWLNPMGIPIKKILVNKRVKKYDGTILQTINHKP